jgi:hypothetical protein
MTSVKDVLPTNGTKGTSDNVRDSGNTKAPSWLGILVGLGFAGVFIAGFVKALWEEAEPSERTSIHTAGTWAYQHWYVVGITLFILIGLALFSPIQRRFRSAEETTRVAVTIFIVLPVVLLTVSAVTFLSAKYQIAALRTLFVLTVCLFPAILYYLFIATRKYGILNEFIVNLDRLGLLSQQGAYIENIEPISRRKIRIASYLNKFQAVYGPLLVAPEEMEELLTAPDFTEAFANSILNRSLSVSLASIFSAGGTLPVLVATVLISIGWLLVLPPAGAIGQSAASGLKATADPEYFAFLGAYFFSVQMLFRRYVRRDLRGGAYAGVSLRIILAVVGTWVAVLVVPGWGPKDQPVSHLFVGFLIGVFPPVLWQLLRQFGKKISGIETIPATETRMPIGDLDGLNLWHQARLEEEDIENVHSMATADLVDLMLSTRFPSERIIDWVDQAILYIHLGPADPSAREHPLRIRLLKAGIRTASELVDSYRSNGAIIQELLHGETPATTLVGALLTNPNLKLIQNWRSLPTGPAETANTQATKLEAGA